MYLETNANHECFGCFACEDICPVNAISTNIKSDTYYYPTVDKKLCVSCGKCKNVCPSIFDEKLVSYPIDSFSGITKDIKNFKKSSSGGAFKCIVKSCNSVFADEYESFYCVGCKFDGLRVVHDIIKVNAIDDIDVFCKSKYIQSNLKGIYKKCKNIVDDPKNFLIFSGTPCQVVAIKKYLSKNGIIPENLFCIDLICRGAPSQFMFDEYVEKIEYKNKSKIVQYEFRTKDKLDNGTFYTRSAKYSLENGVIKRLSRLEDEYLKLFYDEEYILRPSCDKCMYQIPYRVGDITIGDAWRINEVYPKVIPTKGVSSIIVQSEKAKRIIDNVKEQINVYELSYDFMIRHNEPLGGIL